MKKGKPTKNKPGKNKPVSSDITAKTRTVLNSLGSVLFFIVVCLLLGVYKYEFLFRAQGLSLFLFDKFFFNAFFLQPGALLPYIGAFLTQFCYYPWLGVVLFALLLFVLQLLVYRVFRINKRFYLLSFIPSALLLLFVTQLDYMIYVMKTPGILYSQLIGLISTVGMVGLYRLKMPLWGRFVFLLLCVCGLYPLIGFYALLAALLAISSGLLKRESARSYVLFVFGLVLILSVPWIYSSFLYLKMNASYSYFAGLPYLDFVGNNAMWYPLLLAYILMFFFLWLGICPFGETVSKKSMVGIVTIYGLSLFSVYWFTYKDPNFHALLIMEHAVEKNDWETLLKEARKAEHPTRSLVMYRNLALFRTGRLCNEMFTYPDGSTPLAISDSAATYITMTQISAPTTFFYFGRPNYAYRWAMESMVRNGPKVDYLKLMAKVSVYNKEKELAHKYLHTLEKTLFYRQWAKTYESYLKDSSLLKKDPDYQAIYPLLQHPNALVEFSAIVESSLLKYYANLKEGTNEMLELSMFAVLTIKKEDLFWEKFLVYAQYMKDKPLPRHILEAAVLYAKLEGREDLQRLAQRYVSEDSALSQRLKRFMQLATQYKGEETEESRAQFKKYFGDTFWYYYFFVNNIKTN